MKQSISDWQFRDAFRDCGRGDQFSYEGLGILYESLCELEEDTGEEIELDVIALCCEFAEDDADDIADNYSIDISDCEDDDEITETVTEYLQDNTYFVGATSDTLLYQAF